MDINHLTAVKIKELRMKMGLTSEYCAQRLGIAKSNYSQLENGKVEISIRRISQIAEILSIPLITLIPGYKSQTIQITNGPDSSINGTQINNSIDPEFIEVVKLAILEMQKTQRS